MPSQLQRQLARFLDASVAHDVNAHEGDSHDDSGAAARAPVRRVGRARFRNDSVLGAASLAPSRWIIAPNGDGPAAAVDSDVRTWSDYHAVLNALSRSAARWQLVPAHELGP